MPGPERGPVFSLAGKACVVTGASRGLGRAIALAFADQGADVVLGARSRADLEAVAREIEAKGRRAVVQPTDVTDLGQIRALADAAVAAARPDRRLGQQRRRLHRRAGQHGRVARRDRGGLGGDGAPQPHRPGLRRPGGRAGDARPRHRRVHHLPLVDRQPVCGARAARASTARARPP